MICNDRGPALAGLLILVPVVLAAQAGDRVQSAFAKDLADLRVDVHPTVVWPGEPMTIRLTAEWVGPRPTPPFPPAPIHGPDRWPAQLRAYGPVARLCLTLRDEVGRAVLTSAHELADEPVPLGDTGDCCGLAEWSWTWDPARAPDGFYVAEVLVGYDDRPDALVGAGFRLGGLPVGAAEIGPPTGPPASESDGLDLPPPLVCRLEARPLRVHPGETVQILLTVANSEQATARRFFPDHRPFGYALLDGDEHVLAAPDYLDDAGLAWLEIGPGESVQRLWTWTWDPDGPTRIPAGCYRLRAGLGGVGERESAQPLELALWRASRYGWALR